MNEDKDGRTKITELPGVVVGGVVETMKGSPMLLAIMLTNLVTIGAIFYFGAEVTKSRSEMMNKLIDRCTPQAGSSGSGQ